MATREENLKKIKSKWFDAMSDDQLEQVAGGTYNEVAGDSRFLNDLGTGCDRYGPGRAFFEYANFSKETAQHWSKFGISVDTSWGGANSYFHDGKSITRREAMLIAAEKKGVDIKNLNFTDY